VGGLSHGDGAREVRNAPAPPAGGCHPAGMSSRATPALAAASPARIAVALLALYLVWGSTYLAIRIVVETIPPLTGSAVRFLIAGSLLYAATIRSGDASTDRPGRLEWRDAAIIGGLLLAGGNGLLAVGEQTVPSGIAALIIATLPLWVAILGRVFFGVVLTRTIVVGTVIGFAGVAVLVWPSGDAGSLDPFGVAVVLLSPVFWATGSLFSRTAHVPRRPLVGTAMQMLAGSAVLFVLALVTGDLFRVHTADITPESVAALVYLVLVGSLVGYTAYVWLLRVAPISLVATYAYVNPVIAVFLGWLVLSEPLAPRTLVAGAIIVVAVAIIVRARGGESRRTPPDEVGEPG
jgi:drug/metabolite transporter (DMT)-like permease